MELWKQQKDGLGDKKRRKKNKKTLYALILGNKG